MSTEQSAMTAPLEKALQTGAPQLGVERIVEVERLTSGLSSKSYRVSAQTSDGPRHPRRPSQAAQQPVSPPFAAMGE